MKIRAPSSLSLPSRRSVQRDQLLKALKDLVNDLAATSGSEMKNNLTAVTEVFIRMVQADKSKTKSKTKRLSLPWAPRTSLLENLQRAHNRTRGCSAEEWKHAIDSLLDVGEASGLLRKPRPSSGERKRRLLAVDLGKMRQGWGLADNLVQVWEFALSSGGSSPEAVEEHYVVSAILMTLVGSYLTFPKKLLPALAHAADRDFSVTDGVLTLSLKGVQHSSKAPPHLQRFQLDLRSRLLWGRLCLFYARHPLRNPPTDHRLLGVAWRDPRHLRNARRRVAEQLEIGPWQQLRHLVQTNGLLWHPPCGISYRAGTFRVAPAPAADCESVGWKLQDNIVPSRSQAQGRASTPLVSSSGKDSQEETDTASTTLHNKLRRILRPLDQDTSDDVRKQMAKALEEVAGGADKPLKELPNSLLLARYAAALLSDCKSYKAATVRTWLSGLWEAIEGVLGDIPLVSLTKTDEVLELAETLLASCSSAESKRVMRQRLKHLLDFLVQRGIAIPPLNWCDPLLVITQETRALRLLGLAQIREAVERFRQDGGPEGFPLAVAVILGGFGGLRRSEVAHLRWIDVAYHLPGRTFDARGTFFIWRSKTLMGKRYVPLRLLAPPWAWEIVEQYAGERFNRRDSREDAWLLTTEGKPWEPDALTERTRPVLRDIAGPGVSFHSLRRACASWLLVRWLVALGRITPPFKDPCFEDEMIERLLNVLPRDPVVGLWGLARLLGHLDPGVTLNHYLGTFEFAEAALADHRLPGVTYRAAAELLQLSDPQARVLLGKATPPISLQSLWEVQRERLMKRRRENSS